jgi:uncharacterized membrane protein
MRWECIKPCAVGLRQPAAGVIGRRVIAGSVRRLQKTSRCRSGLPLQKMIANKVHQRWAPSRTVQQLSVDHGIVKTYLIVGLLRDRLWYYPGAIIVFILFVAYQVFRFQITHSVWLLAITVLDIVVIGLTWHEYRYLRSRSKT